MVFTLVRAVKRPDGIISTLFDANQKIVALTLEHAYLQADGKSYSAKIPTGIFKCVRGPHRLHGMTQDFETFEVTNVPNCQGILFHWGNYNKDSDGCILLGANYVVTPNGEAMVTASKLKFAEFMTTVMGTNEFTLTVREHS